MARCTREFGVGGEGVGVAREVPAVEVGGRGGRNCAQCSMRPDD